MKHASVQQQKRRRRSGRWRSAGRRLAAALLLALCLAAPAQASETQTVHDSSGRAMFQISFFDEGEHVLTYADGGTLVGERDLTDLDREGTVRAAGLWADILGPYGANSSPVVVHVTGDYTYNAAAVGDVLPPSAGSAYSASRALAQIGEGLETDEIAGLVFSGLGVSDSASWVAANHLSALPYTDRPDLVTVIFHEFGHLLGISSSISSMETNVFLNELGSASVWDSHLHDICGTQVQAGMRAVRAGTEAEGDAGAVFVAGVGPTSGVTFRGEHVAEVLQGAMEGVPVNGFEGSDASGWKAELAHIELNHSLMSHQLWRNWTSFMEAELAVLQDLGYQIDRRNWYGYSVYNDGLTLTSTTGYWARNAEGTAYLEGVANTSTLGVGLHVYGSNNQITQAADLMACGTAGTGIRLEGAGNTLAVAEGVTVAADGDWGTGLLVSYGRDHLVTNSGTVTATGEGGIAVRFDFGKNSISEESESRGSWIWGSDAESGWTDMDMSRGTDNDGLPLNLDGPMVSRFALSGTLAGSAAAIYISDNAYVEQMDILSGASITGDIVSNWDPESARLQYADLNPGHSGTELTTLVTFGLAATDQGIGGETGDAAFCLVYDGNITGASSLEIEVAGGALEYNGTASVLSVTIDEGASLSGTGSWTLNAILDEEQDISVGGTFTNAGTYSPG
ncbi:MAG: autotransporter outer membrane beta-barrel domain-containing protein, partial [Desulfovibrionaceae bacterium]|nr:autotransporter outer membrane beta-barrel domain-containing protein [Desulfovibrionaceae bacterium]